MCKAPILSISDSVGLFQFTYIKQNKQTLKKLPKQPQNKHRPITYLGTWTHSIKSLTFDITSVITLKLFTEVGFLYETQQSIKGALESLPHPEIHKIRKTKNRQVGEYEKCHTKYC